MNAILVNSVITVFGAGLKKNKNKNNTHKTTGSYLAKHLAVTFNMLMFGKPI